MEPVDEDGSKVLLPGYGPALSELIQDLMVQVMEAESPFLASLPRVVGTADDVLADEDDTTAARLEISRERGDLGSVTPLSVSAVVDVEADDVVSCNIGAFTAALYELCHSIVDGQARAFFQAIGATLDAAGRTFDGRGREVNGHFVIDLLEKIDFDVDEDMKIVGLQLVTSPRLFEKLIAVELTPEENARMTEFMQRRREATLAKKRIRRLG